MKPLEANVKRASADRTAADVDYLARAPPRGQESSLGCDKPPADDDNSLIRPTI